LEKVINCIISEKSGNLAYFLEKKQVKRIEYSQALEEKQVEEVKKISSEKDSWNN
jgi:hypothetical protein